MSLQLGQTRARFRIGEYGRPLKPYYGETPVMGIPYITGYEPINDASGAIIGVYGVGYKK
jgi:hypothetical protein